MKKQRRHLVEGFMPTVHLQVLGSGIHLVPCPRPRGTAVAVPWLKYEPISPLFWAFYISAFYTFSQDKQNLIVEHF